MKLFVTGSESFIGKRLFERCRKLGIEAVGIDSVTSDNSYTTCADIRDVAIADLIPDGATVVHLAAISRDPDCRANQRLAFDVNVNGTLNVATVAEKRNVKQLIFASSEWVYGEVKNDGVQREEDSIDVTAMKSEYAITKIVGEQCLKLACKLPAVTVLRFGIVYGPRPSNWSAVEALFNAVREKDVVSVGSLSTGRRFIHIDDIVAGILKSAGRAGFEIFNLSGDKIVTLGDIIKQSSEILDKHPKIEERNPQIVSIRNPDNTMARGVLDWKPIIGLKEGLTTLI